MERTSTFLVYFSIAIFTFALSQRYIIVSVTASPRADSFIKTYFKAALISNLNRAIFGKTPLRVTRKKFSEIRIRLKDSSGSNLEKWSIQDLDTTQLLFKMKKEQSLN